MKKLSSLLVFLVTILFSLQAQNYIGFSKNEIISEITTEGIKYIDEKNKYGIPYLLIANKTEKVLRVYYFDSKNTCVKYVVFFEDGNYITLLNTLNKNYKRFGDKWYDLNTEIELKYDTEMKGYLMEFNIYDAKN